MNKLVVKLAMTTSRGLLDSHLFQGPNMIYLWNMRLFFYKAKCRGGEEKIFIINNSLLVLFANGLSALTWHRSSLSDLTKKGSLTEVDWKHACSQNVMFH